MIYRVNINKKVRNIKVVHIIKKLEGNPNLLTRFFIRIFAGKKKEY
ncbi:MAG: hypothetical protein ACP5UN_01015 [Candidatus Micrarchaeia archaeon]